MTITFYPHIPIVPIFPSKKPALVLLVVTLQQISQHGHAYIRGLPSRILRL